MHFQAAAVVGAFSFVSAALAIPPHVRVVNPDSGGDGSSWSAAFSNLQDALDAAAASQGAITEIWLAAGTHTPRQPRMPGFGQTRPFQLVQGVAIYGGFAGHEQEREQRDIAANITILSGDGGEFRAFHVVSARGVDRTAVLDGVVITGGVSGVSGSDARGAGISIISASPTIRDCAIIGNTALSGGGVVVEGGSPLFVRTHIEGNSAVTAGTGGGGILILGGQPAFLRCTIVANTAIGPTAGGGIAIHGGNVALRDCTIADNSCEVGGALYSSAGSTLLNNCLVRNNRDGIVGQNLTLLHCTIVENIPTQQLAWGGVTGTGTMVGCIVWDNAEPQMRGILPQVWGSIQANFSCIAPNSYGPQLSGDRLIRLDPLLTPEGKLSPLSPCIDAADNLAIPSSMTLDLAGLPRLVDDPGSANTGRGSGAIADMGAYEFQGASCYANCDGSTEAPILNSGDFACFMARFTAGDPRANCDGSTQSSALNIYDFECFMNRFLAGCP